MRKCAAVISTAAGHNNLLEVNVHLDRRLDCLLAAPDEDGQPELSAGRAAPCVEHPV